MLAEEWLRSEDCACLEQRKDRLEWLLSNSAGGDIWLFPGGLVSKQLFEEAKYCFVYGQYIATLTIAYAYVERTVAARLYAAGNDRAERASSESLIKDAEASGWLSAHEAELFNRVRRLRNPVMHFRKPLHTESVEARAFAGDSDHFEVLEKDARDAMLAAFRMVSLNAVRG